CEGNLDLRALRDLLLTLGARRKPGPDELHAALGIEGEDRVVAPAGVVDRPVLGMQNVIGPGRLRLEELGERDSERMGDPQHLRDRRRRMAVLDLRDESMSYTGEGRELTPC